MAFLGDIRVFHFHIDLPKHLQDKKMTNRCGVAAYGKELQNLTNVAEKENGMMK